MKIQLAKIEKETLQLKIKEQIELKKLEMKKEIEMKKLEFQSKKHEDEVYLKQEKLELDKDMKKISTSIKRSNLELKQKLVEKKVEKDKTYDSARFNFQNKSPEEFYSRVSKTKGLEERKYIQVSEEDDDKTIFYSSNNQGIAKTKEIYDLHKKKDKEREEEQIHTQNKSNTKDWIFQNQEKISKEIEIFSDLPEVLEQWTNYLKSNSYEKLKYQFTLTFLEIIEYIQTLK